jgi:hypothetical protein
MPIGRKRIARTAIVFLISEWLAEAVAEDATNAIAYPITLEKSE